MVRHNAAIPRFYGLGWRFTRGVAHGPECPLQDNGGLVGLFGQCRFDGLLRHHRGAATRRGPRPGMRGRQQTLYRPAASFPQGAHDGSGTSMGQRTRDAVCLRLRGASVRFQNPQEGNDLRGACRRAPRGGCRAGHPSRTRRCRIDTGSSFSRCHAFGRSRQGIGRRDAETLPGITPQSVPAGLAIQGGQAHIPIDIDKTTWGWDWSASGWHADRWSSWI